MRWLIGGLIGLVSLGAAAAPFDTVQVHERVWALVGSTGQRSAENLGHNMTSGFIVGDEAVAVIDSGGSRRNARAIHAAIEQITDKPVRWVINTGGQDHRWFGNGYFQEEGARIIASQAAVADMKARKAQQIARMKRLIGDAFAGTKLAYPDVTFEDRHSLSIKGLEVVVIHRQGGHTPGDSFVWLPEQSLVFTGDLVFVERMLRILPNASALDWIASLEYMRDELDPEVVIPGHGDVTDLDTAMRDTYGYLTLLRERVQARIDAGAFDPVEASTGLDQSEFAYLEHYDDLSVRATNAARMADALFARQ